MTATLYVPSIVIDTVIDAVGDFLQPFVGAAQIVRAQTNRVPMPGDSCVVLTEIMSADLETPTVTDDTVNQQNSFNSPKRFDVQIDFYGPDSGDQCNAVKGTFRTPYAVANFPANIAPLYCSDGIQSPLVTGEEQWESRWTLTASLQYNPSVVVPQQSATQYDVTLIERA